MANERPASRDTEQVGSVDVPSPRRRLGVRWAIAAVSLAALLLAGTGFLAFRVMRPAVQQGVQVASEWQSRLETDYPDWKVVGFNTSRQFDATGATTVSTFRAVPPGYSFDIGIVYLSTSGGEPRRLDEVLSRRGSDHPRAGALLRAIAGRFISKGYAVDGVEALENGDVRVHWSRTTSWGPFHSTKTGYDDLLYEDGTGEYAIYRSSI